MHKLRNLKKYLSLVAIATVISLLTILIPIWLGKNHQPIAQSTEITRTSALESVFSDQDIEFSFVVIGCNRVEKTDIKSTLPSTANIEQLQRTFTEIAALSPAPKFLFFAGDMVYGYNSDPNVLESELKGWRELYEKSPLASTPTTLITIPGNHEVQNEKKVAYLEAEKTWLNVMAPYLQYAGNGPKAGGPDNLKTDQSSLTYSFEYNNTHFLILNTDPVGKDWSVPLNWINQDLDEATKNQVEHIFAIGHKPAYTYPLNLYRPAEKLEDGLGRLYPQERDQFWDLLVKSRSEAMLTAHNHLYYRTKGPKGNTWQIIAGNGGSQLDSVADQKSVNFFGFTVINVLKNGHITLTSYGRDVPTQGYLAPSSAHPTTVRDQADLTWID